MFPAPQGRSVTGGRSKLDPDVATLSLKLDEHLQALTQDAVVSGKVILLACMHQNLQARRGSS